ncbi:MAG: hypothetical protein RIS76_4118 [Verrucomicrobiota bacterium]|jgi:hypothetical protein
MSLPRSRSPKSCAASALEFDRWGCVPPRDVPAHSGFEVGRGWNTPLTSPGSMEVQMGNSPPPSQPDALRRRSCLQRHDAMPAPYSVFHWLVSSASQTHVGMQFSATTAPYRADLVAHETNTTRDPGCSFPSPAPPRRPVRRPPALSSVELGVLRTRGVSPV